MKPMLANELHAHSKKIFRGRTYGSLVLDGWLVQPKYDGVFGMFQRGLGMVSRTGKPLVIRPELRAELEALPMGPKDWLIGELWLPRTEFSVISGRARLKTPGPFDQLHFMVHDMVSAEDPGLPYISRHAMVAGGCGLRDCGERVRAVRRDIIPVQLASRTPAEVEDALRDGFGAMQDANEGFGYDGWMLKDPNASYKIGERSREGELIKLKYIESVTATVTEVFVTPGARTGRPVYTLAVKYDGGECIVGSGVPHDLGDVPAPGERCEIACLGRYPTGALREPRYVGRREDA